MDIHVVKPSPLKTGIGALLFLSLFINPFLFAAEMTMHLSCQSYPSPYLSDWATTPGIVHISIYYTGSVPETLRLVGRAVSDEHGEIVSGRSENIIITGGQTILRDNRDFFNYQNIEYSDPYVEQLTRTGRLLEGTYTLYMQLVRARTGAVITERSCVFHILSFDQPSLIVPADNDTIWIAAPVFQWTPATNHPGFTVRYHLKVCEKGPRQTPQMAINNIAHHEQVIENAVSFIYPNTARPLDADKIYVWQVQARDRNDIPIGENEGKSEIRQFQKRALQVFQPPLTFPPQIQVTRSVVRHDNYFEVILELRNTGLVEVDSAVIVDLNKGFQSQKVVWERSKAREESWHLSWSRAESEVEYIPRFLSSEVKVKLLHLRADQDRQIRYFVVPILFAPEVLAYPRIGEGFAFYYYASGTRYQPRINAYEIWYSNAAEVNNAMRAADYLIVTNPGRLFERDPESDVNALLCTMADMAIAKRGALGYTPLTYTAYQLKTALRGTGIWGSKTSSGWPENGYLLLVGECEIVPAFTIFIGADEYPIIDYPYADIDGDDLPELRVGRIIGQTASELMTPINTSLNVHYGRGSYDGSDALLVSGPEGPWYEGIIPNVEGARPDLRNEGVAFQIVHTEYYTARRVMLEEALRIKGPGCGGTRDDADLSSFTLPKLTAWLLESEGRLVIPPGATITRFHDTEGRLRRLPDPMNLDNIDEAYRIAESAQIPQRGGNYGTYLYFPDGGESGHHINWYAEKQRSTTIKNNASNKDLILFSGHGDPGGWCGSLTEWIGSGSEIEPISFGGTNPIVIAFSCQTGYYDLYDAATGTDISIAKAFLRNGAAAYIGATRTSGAGGCDEMTNNGWWIYWSKDSRIGDAFFNFQNDKIRQEGYYGFVHEYNLYGDPKFSRR